MSLTIGIPKETALHEKRVAATPDSVKKYASMGCAVLIQSDAGLGASFTDDMYETAGAKIVKSANDLLSKSDVVLCVQPPNEADLSSLKKGAYLIGMLSPQENSTVVNACTKAGACAFSMELLPRITRAQAMDVLSSQANLAGYKSVLDAAEHFNRAFPMMMTAAGTVPPAKVFVMGAGVAGLQAIATAKRLGAVVSATDVRPAAKEQVESLGATFIAVEDEEFKNAETAGGYAKEMSKEYQSKQQKLIEDTIAKQDIVITTALIPGRPAPKLISGDMVKSMKQGAVIVDLAVERGGNCVGSKAGKIVEDHGVIIVGNMNIPSRLAASATSLYARNLQNLITLIIDPDTKKLKIDWNDEIIKGIAVTKDGAVVHPTLKSQDASTKTTTKKAATSKSNPKKPAVKTATKKKTPANKATAKKSPPKKKAPAKTSASKTATTSKTTTKKA